MNLIDLQNQIKNRNLETNLFIFQGTQKFLINTYVNQICKTTNKSKKVSDFSEIYNNIKSSFDTKKYTYVIYESDEFRENENLWNDDFLKNSLHNFIFIYYDLDKRSKFIKQNNITKFEDLSENIIKKYIKKDYDILDKNIDIICNYCNNDYDKIILELDKLKNLALADNTSVDNIFEDYNIDDILIYTLRDETFNFVDLVLNKNKNCYILLEDLKALDTNFLGILSLLYNNFRNVLLVQSCKDNNIVETTGLNNWEIKNAKKYTNIYTIEELVYILKLLYKIDKNAKIGNIESELAIDYFLIKIL